jgi:hypothetical protein
VPEIDSSKNIPKADEAIFRPVCIELRSICIIFVKDIIIENWTLLCILVHTL